MDRRVTPVRERDPYIGWYAGGIVVLLVFVAAAVVWFTFHPW